MLFYISSACGCLYSCLNLWKGVSLMSWKECLPFDIHDYPGRRFLLTLGLTSEKWYMRDTLGPSHWSFNSLNTYNLTKDSLLNAQASLRDPCNETSKCVQMGTKGRARKERDSEHPQTQPCSQEFKAGPKEERNLVVPGAPFSWEEQRNLVSIPAGVGSAGCSWAHRPGKDTAWTDTVLRWSVFQAEKQSYGSFAYQSSPPFALDVRLWSTLSANPRACTMESLSLLNKGCTLRPVLGQGAGGTQWRSKATNTRKTKQQRSWPVPQPSPPPAVGYTDSIIWLGWGRSTGISES